MKKNKYILFFLLLSTVFIFYPKLALAEGGEAGTIAEIEFYTEDAKVPPKDKDPGEVKKPVGRFPNTGDVIQKSLMMSGSMLAIMGIWFFFVKRKKRKDDMEI